MGAGLERAKQPRKPHVGRRRVSEAREEAAQGQGRGLSAIWEVWHAGGLSANEVHNRGRGGGATEAHKGAGFGAYEAHEGGRSGA